jgi:hypothetical protein
MTQSHVLRAHRLQTNVNKDYFLGDLAALANPNLVVLGDLVSLELCCPLCHWCTLPFHLCLPRAIIPVM